MPLPRIPALERLRATLRDVGGTHEVVLTGLPAAEAAKLAHLKASGRDFLSLAGPHARAQIVSYVRAEAQAAVARGDMRTFRFAQAIDAGLHALVRLRFERGGNDVRLAPLDPGYVRWKAAHGKDPRVGIATGALLRALAAARFALRKR